VGEARGTREIRETREIKKKIFVSPYSLLSTPLSQLSKLSKCNL
jgi:hypothetical protein